MKYYMREGITKGETKMDKDIFSQELKIMGEELKKTKQKLNWLKKENKALRKGIIAELGKRRRKKNDKNNNQ